MSDLIRSNFQDPGISSTQPRGSYPAYDTGIEMGIFLNDSTGKPIVGKVINRELALFLESL